MSTNPTPAKTPAATPKKKNRAGGVLAAMLIPIAFIGGCAAGSSGSDAAPAPDPVVVTETPEPVVKTETKTIEKVPDVCITALNDADRVNELAGDGFTIAGEVMGAAGQFDVEGMNASVEKLDKVQPKYQDAMTEYYLAAELCRSSGK